MPDGAVVATFGIIGDSEWEKSWWDSATNTTKTYTHYPKDFVEIPECRVIYRRDRTYAPIQDVDIRTYKAV